MRPRPALGTEDREVRGERRPTPDGDDNVVRFPREWLGPREELVPFGPDADEDQSFASPEDGPADFWGEGSAAVQAVFEASPPGDAPRRRWRPTVSLPHARRAVWACGLVVVLLLLLVMGSIIGGGASHPPATHKPAISAASVAALDSAIADVTHAASTATRRRVASRRISRRPIRPAVHHTTRRASPRSAPKTTYVASSVPQTGASAAVAQSAQVGSASSQAPATESPHPSATGALSCISGCGTP